MPRLWPRSTNVVWKALNLAEMAVSEEEHQIVNWRCLPGSRDT
jgi:hypothetical protein